MLVATASLGALALFVGWQLDAPARFAALTLLVLVAELLPIPVPRRHGLDKVTVSTVFAFAALLCAGILPACLAYAASSVIGDLWSRMSPVKVAFNAAQYVLSVAAAGFVLIVAGAGAPTGLHATAVPAILLAALAWFVINHVLAGAGAALLARAPGGAVSARRSSVPRGDRRLAADACPGSRRVVAGKLRADPRGRRAGPRDLLRRASGRDQRSPCVPRPPHRPAESLAPVREPRQEAAGGRACAIARCRDDRRPRRLQVDQRHARSRVRRSGAPADRAAARGGARIARAPRPPRRR